MTAMLASSLAVGIILGVATGGKLRRLQALPLRWIPLLLAILAVRVIALVTPLPLGVFAAVLLATIAAAGANAHLPGALAIAAGSLLNLFVVVLNGGMPVSEDAAAAAAAATHVGDGLHVPFSPATQVALLADVIPVALFRSVYSVGDLVVAAGAFWLPFAWLRRT